MEEFKFGPNYSKFLDDLFERMKPENAPPDAMRVDAGCLTIRVNDDELKELTEAHKAMGWEPPNVVSGGLVDMSGVGRTEPPLLLFVGFETNAWFQGNVAP